MKYIKKLHIAFIVNLLLCLTAIFFSSMEVYLGNLAEFCFSAKHVWWVMLLTAILSAVCLAAIESLLPKKVLFAILTLTIAISICFYLQSLFLNGSLQEMTGEKVEYNNIVVFVNLVQWIIIVIGTSLLFFLIIRKYRDYSLCKLLIFISLGLIVIQLSGLISIASSLDTSEKNKDYYLSREGEFSLSDGRNVLLFVLDTCDQEYVNAALEEDPGLFDEFTGFVRYPDAISMYSRTYPSLPYILTGEKCFFDVPTSDYLEKAYKNSTFLPAIDAEETDIRIYTSIEYLDEGIYDKINNIAKYDSKDLSVISVPELIKAMLHLGGYREMPYFLKHLFSYGIDPINRNVLVAPPDSYYTFTSEDFAFYSRLKETNLSIRPEYTSVFRLYHLFGPHPGCFTSEEAKYDPKASPTDSFRGDIYILNEYIRQLKSLGIYDNTAIIVTADHGNQNENEELILHQPPCCIMLLKRAESDSSIPMTISNSHVSHEDLFSTVLKEYGIETADFSESLFEHEDDLDRVRTYYYTAQRSWGDGEIALKEYKITGDARDFSNWKQTGKEWEIRYSLNAISQEK